jgi:hypothetical protein
MLVNPLGTSYEYPTRATIAKDKQPRNGLGAEIRAEADRAMLSFCVRPILNDGPLMNVSNKSAIARVQSLTHKRLH